MSDVKQTITDNLIALRKSRNLTQQDVASYLNYTDKAVSRWETGESLPDISVLQKLAEFYGVDFEYLIKAHDEPVKPEKPAANHIKVAVFLLFAVCCFTLATIAYVYSIVIDNRYYWVAFIWALPASFLIGFILSNRWWNRILTASFLSATVWTLILGVYLQLIYWNITDVWALFLLGVPIQLIIVLLLYIRKDK